MLATHSPFRPALTTPGAWAFLHPGENPGSETVTKLPEAS